MRKIIATVTLLVCVLVGSGSTAVPSVTEDSLYNISPAIKYEVMDTREAYEYADMVFSELDGLGIPFNSILIDEVLTITYDETERFVVFELPYLYEPDDKVYGIVIGESVIFLEGKVLEGGAVMFDFSEVPADVELVMFILHEARKK